MLLTVSQAGGAITWMLETQVKRLAVGLYGITEEEVEESGLSLSRISISENGFGGNPSDWKKG